MRVVVARGVSAVLLVSLGLAALGSTPGTAGAVVAGRVEAESLCRDTLGDTGPQLRPASDAAPGQVVAVGVTWRKEAWSGDRLAEIVTCASVDGRLAPELTTWEASPENDGEATVSLTMPEDLVGSVVCQQTLLVGVANGEPSTGKANPFCFRIVPQGGAPAAPVAPAAVPGPREAAPAATPKETPKEEASAPPASPAPPAPEAAKVLGEALTKPPSPAAAPDSAAGQPSPTGLPHTGAAERSWTAAAGMLLALGGLAVALGAPTARSRAFQRR
jgi:hypothetical protein